MLCCCLHSLIPRQYRQALFGGAAAAGGRQQQWEQGEDEEEDDVEEYDFDGEEGGEEGGMYEMVPPSPQAGDDDDVCLLMGPAGVKLEKSAGAGAVAAAVAPSIEATTVAAAARGRETRKGVMAMTLRKDGGIVRGKKVEETKDEAEEGGEVRAVVENVPHECVICLEEFTRENPEMHTRKDLRGKKGGREGRRVCK